MCCFPEVLLALLLVGVVVARPSPPEPGGASEHNNEDDEGEQKICISFKGNAIGEVTQVKGELPPQLVLKLSGHSRPKMVHYKVVTADGEEFYPQVKMLTRANVTPDSLENRGLNEGTFSTTRVIPVIEDSLNKSSEWNSGDGATERSAAENNATERSSSEGENSTTPTFDPSTVTPAITQSILIVTADGTASTLETASGTDDVSYESNNDVGAQLVETESISANSSGVTTTEIEYREVTNSKSLDISTPHRTQGEEGVEAVSIKEYGLDSTTTDGVDITTNTWSSQGHGGNFDRTMTKNYSISESPPEAAVYESTVEKEVTGENNTFTPKVTPIPTQIVTGVTNTAQGVALHETPGVVAFKQERQNETGVPNVIDTEEEFEDSGTTVARRTVTDGTPLTMIPSTLADKGTYSEIDAKTTSRTTTDNQEPQESISIGDTSTTIAPNGESTLVDSLKKFQDLHPEIKFDDQGKVIDVLSDETLDDLDTNGTTVRTSTEYSTEADKEMKTAPEVDEERRFDSTTPSQIITSKSGGVVQSGEPTMKPPDDETSTNSDPIFDDETSENVTGGNGESTEGGPEGNTPSDTFRKLDEDELANINVTSPPEVIDEQTVKHRFLSSDEHDVTELVVDQSGSTQVTISATGLVSSTKVDRGESVVTQPVHHEGGANQLSDRILASGGTTTPETLVSGNEFKTSSLPEVTSSTKADAEKINVVTVSPPANKTIRIYNSLSESHPDGDGSPSPPPHRQLEDWEKFNNFTIIFPSRKGSYQSYNPINYRVLGGYNQPGNFYTMYNRARGQIQIVHLPWARQI
ncbi:hypothetical protein GE061_000240 [Apolygus lucorum]|uniref:Uncharacterized protein n=1 Tax=Apolygus lucorum TaxID=248454 RepID=A0A6A4J584_APOLU|nr:hypothetical protein GE061_000240 [Apolygus lucorum]